MHPALSVIFFTTLSGAGYGLLAWLGVILAGTGRNLPAALPASAATPRWMVLLLVLLVLGGVLTSVGLLLSMLHLGKPQRAWRAFSQWRTSWLSREGVMALLTFVPLAILLVLVSIGVVDGNYDPRRFATWVPALGIAMTVLSLLTVACTGMIYASLTPIPAWRHRLVMPAYLLVALLSGGLLLLAVVSLWGYGSSKSITILAVVAIIVIAAVKLKYWHDIDIEPLPATRGDAVGLPGRKVDVFERPHTEANYLTREMAFVVARRHATRLRWLALLLFGAIPLACMALAWLLPGIDAMPWLVVAALSALAGAFVERWLFFAQARHMVTLYY
jgi:DMSO reductase anchor subunit